MNTELLSERTLVDIEARHKLASRVFQPYKEVGDSLSDIPALCQTVRAMREDLRQGALCETCDQWENNEDGNPRTFMVCGACWNDLQAKNTALRGQLAQSQAENERLASQLKEWQEEKDAKAGYL